MTRYLLIFALLLGAVSSWGQKYVSDLVVSPAFSGGTIKWYNAANAGTEYTSPATTVLANGQKYYASQTVNGVESTERVEVTATLAAAPTGGTIAPASASVCSGTNSTLLTVSDYTNGTVIRWESSLTSDFASHSDINNTDASYTVTNLTTTTYYRAVIDNASCPEVTSEVATVTISPCLPTVTTTTITAGTTTTPYTSGGNVTNGGGSLVTAKGICWSTSANPTTDNAHTTDATGTGSFTSILTGLVAGQTYHVRAFATNSGGTAYGSDVSFTAGATGSFIGEARDGGIVFFTNGTNGFIAATSDAGTAPWGCAGTWLNYSNSTGAANTTEIISRCADVGNAAGLCVALGAGWYLPTVSEFSNMYSQKAVIGGFVSSIYWTSAQNGEWSSYSMSIITGLMDNATMKTTSLSVRAIRSF